MDNRELSRCKDDILYFLEKYSGFKLSQYQKDFIVGIDLASEPSRTVYTVYTGRRVTQLLLKS